MTQQAIGAGIFVGGRGRRMGGVAKGLLHTTSGRGSRPADDGGDPFRPADDGGDPTILARSASILGSLGLAPILVGVHPAYAGTGLPSIADDPGAEGPLAGLIALLEFGDRRGWNAAIAVACDMPYLSADLTRRLLLESVSSPKESAGRGGVLPAAKCDGPSSSPAIVAAQRDGRWEPFFARYDIARVLPIARDRARQRQLGLQGLLDACEAVPLPLTPAEADELRDWDTPDDVARAAFEPRRQ